MVTVHQALLMCGTYINLKCSLCMCIYTCAEGSAKAFVDLNPFSST